MDDRVLADSRRAMGARRSARRLPGLLSLGLVAVVACQSNQGNGGQGNQTAPSGTLAIGQSCPLGGNYLCSDPTTPGAAPSALCSLVQGVCAPVCMNDGDCASHLCLDDNTCAVSTPCEPVTSTGCPGVQTCTLFLGNAPPDQITACVDPVGSAARDGITVFYEYEGNYGSSGELSMSEHLCRLGQADCPSGTTCLPLDGPPIAPVDGVSFGTCRTPCTVGSDTCPNPAPQCSGCTSQACTFETTAGRAPIASCLQLAGVYCNDGAGNGVLCASNVPVAPTCLTAWRAGCSPSCATDSDCPKGATCSAGECAARPLPCDPFQAAQSCGATQTCVVQPDGAGGGTVACESSGGATWPAGCTSDTDCAAGQACTHYGDPTHGICEKECNLAHGTPTSNPQDDPPCASSNQRCVSDDPPVTIVVPNPLSAAPPDSWAMGTCRVTCDPVAPSNACLSGFTCVPFADPGGVTQTDCISTTAMGMGPNACASGPLACAPGYTCRDSDKSCLKWCYVGVASSCPTGQTCTSASPAVVVGGVAYGTCQ